MDIREALLTRDHEKVRAILESDPAAANARLPDGATPLRIALYMRSEEDAKLIIAAGAHVDVYDAATMGDTARMLALLVDPSIPSGDGHLPLHLAAHFGHVDAVRALLARGAHVAQLSPALQNTALHAACAGGRDATARVLIDAGAPVDIADGNGYRPLHVAAANGSAACVRLLLEVGADAGGRMGDGRRALDVAVDRKNHEAAAILREAAP